MQDWAVAVFFVDAAARHFVHRRLGRGNGKRLPCAIADPRALLLAGVLDVEEAYRSAILLEFVLDLSGQGKGLGAGHVNAAILKLVGQNAPLIKDGDGDQAAGLGAACIAGPLEDGNGAQFGRVLAALGHLAGILRAERQRGEEGE